MKTWVVLVSLIIEADDQDVAVREANRDIRDGIVESIVEIPTPEVSE